jgi:hypothetical protein
MGDKMKSAGAAVIFAAGLAGAFEAGKKSAEPDTGRGTFVFHDQGAQANFKLTKDGQRFADKSVLFGVSNKGVTTVGTVADKDLPKELLHCLKAYNAGKFDAVADAPVVPRPAQP